MFWPPWPNSMKKKNTFLWRNVISLLENKAPLLEFLSNHYSNLLRGWRQKREKNLCWPFLAWYIYILSLVYSVFTMCIMCIMYNNHDIECYNPPDKSPCNLKKTMILQVVSSAFQETVAVHTISRGTCNLKLHFL